MLPLPRPPGVAKGDGGTAAQLYPCMELSVSITAKQTKKPLRASLDLGKSLPRAEQVAWEERCLHLALPPQGTQSRAESLGTVAVAMPPLP